MVRAVLDPGVLIAALLSPRGAPASLLLRWLEGAFELIVSSQLLAELEAVLRRPKFRGYVTAEEVADYLVLLRSFATVVPDPASEPGATPDPGDDYLVALARSIGADCLVSGDPHLTDLRRLRPPVVTPRAFLRMIAPE